MVEHLVLMKWKENTPEESVQAAFEGLRALRNQIPGVLQLTCGVNFSDRAGGFDAGLYVRFTNRAALDTYIAHPAHQEVVNSLLAPIRSDVIALDFEAAP